MKLTHIIVFCIILVVRGSSCESTCQNLVMNSCNVCYNSCTEAFVSCYRTTCDVFAEEQQGVGPCDQYDMQELSEAKCFQKCCYDVTDKTFSKDQLDVCSQDDQRALGILIGVTVGSIFLLVGIGVLLMWKIGGINPCQFCCVSENQPTIPPEVSKNIMKQKEADLEWKRQSKQKLLTSKCRRCKKQKPRVIGKCGCFLHFSCANDFAIRSSLCGQCFNNINPIKYYCDKCYNGYVSITIPKNYNSATTEKIVARLQCPFCNEIQAEDIK